MAKDSTVSARVQSDIKTEAETILKNLGIPVSVVINSLYRQIIYKHGLPFELTVPVEPVTLDSMSKEEFDKMMQHSYEQSLAGQGVPASEFFDKLERDMK
jgi:addiction module RelB/DinJ family antitoxin